MRKILENMSWGIPFFFIGVCVGVIMSFASLTGQEEMRYRKELSDCQISLEAAEKGWNIQTNTVNKLWAAMTPQQQEEYIKSTKEAETK